MLIYYRCLMRAAYYFGKAMSKQQLQYNYALSSLNEFQKYCIFYQDGMKS